MPAPRVTIQEIIEGAAAVRARTATRVGMIGTSTRGRHNTFTLVSTDADLVGKIGFDTKPGSVGLRVARDEGATDEAFVRVMGAARRATGIVTLAGTGTAADSVRITLDNGTTPVNYTTALSNGETAAAIVSELIDLINADANSYAVASPDSLNVNRIVLTARTAGAAGNDITFLVTEIGVDPDDITATPAVETNLSGGANGPTAAFANFVSGAFRLEAAGHGVYGNFISYQWIPGAQARTATLRLTDDRGVVTNTLISFNEDALLAGGEFSILRQSYVARLFYTGSDLAAETVFPTGTGNLASGGEGSTITMTDYLDALTVLGNNSVAFVLAPYQTDSSLRAALLAQAEGSTILGGLRIAILNAPKGLLATEAADATSTFNSATGSAVMVAGWCTYAGEPKLADLSVSPDCFYAGILARTPIQNSPAAKTTVGYFRTVGGVDTEATEPAQDLYTDARLEAIALDLVSGGYAPLNGRTLSSNQAHYYVSIRRVANKLKTLAFLTMQPLKSENKSDGLLSAGNSAISQIIRNAVDDREIRGGSVTNVFFTGGGMRLDFRWLPFYPADAIDLGMYRDAVDVSV